MKTTLEKRFKRIQRQNPENKLHQNIRYLQKLFVCIGAQKAGTSWLHYVLQDTPELSFPPVKEIHYFDRVHMNTKALDRRRKAMANELTANNPEEVRIFRSKKILSENSTLNKKLIFAFGEIGDSWYSSLYNKELIATDITPAYSVLPESGFRHISKIADSVKVLFVMRDPVDRMLSQVRYKFNEELRIYQGRESKRIDEADPNELKNICNLRGVIARSNYPETIKKLYQIFSKENLKLIFYDKLCDAPDEFISEVCEFVDIKSIDASVEKLQTGINVGEKFNFPDVIENQVKETCKPIVKELKSMLPELPESWLDSVDL